jgi:hypothetical protein
VTFAVAVQVHDGVVLASDSATTLTDPNKPPPDNVVNVYNNANKIFNLYKGLPIGGMTYGMGSIGSSSISTLAKDLRKRFCGLDKENLDWKVDLESFTIEEIANKARTFFFDEMYVPLGIKPSAGVQFGFIVAGYSAGEQLSETWLIQIADGGCNPPEQVIDRGVTNTYAAGDPEAFSRLTLGYSSKLKPALVKLGMDAADVSDALKIIEQELHEPLVVAPMPIIDVIDYAEFLVHATSMFTRFKRGAATVGGPIESAAITKHEGFRWTKRKHYFSSELNPT